MASEALPRKFFRNRTQHKEIIMLINTRTFRTKTLREQFTAGCVLGAVVAFMSIATLTHSTSTHAQARENRGEVSLSLFGLSWKPNYSTSFGKNRTVGSGVVKEATRDVQKFSRLELELPANVMVVQVAASESESLSIQADDNVIPLIKSDVSNGVLRIYGDRERGFSTKNEIKMKLNVKTLDGIELKGSGDVFGESLTGDKLDIIVRGSGDVGFKSLKANEFSVAVKGSGDIKVLSLAAKNVTAQVHGSGDISLGQMDASDTKLSVHGSGDVKAEGKSDRVDIEVHGSGDVRAGSLKARDATVRVRASGDAEVYASEKLVASVMGSGDIRYSGAPKDVSRDVKGSGDIVAR
jgi:hypothetical protein